MRWQPLTIAELGDRITVTAVDIRVGRPMVMFACLLLLLGTVGIIVNVLWGKAYDQWEFDVERNGIVPAIAIFLTLGVAFFLVATHLFLRPRTYTVDRKARELQWGNVRIPLDEVARVHAERLPARGALVDYWQLMVTRRDGEQLAASIATENGWLWSSTALVLIAAIDAARSGGAFIEPPELTLSKGVPTLMSAITWFAIAMVILDILFFLGAYLLSDRVLPRSLPPPPPPAARP